MILPLALMLTGPSVLSSVEPPLQLLRVNGLWIGKYEVMQSQFHSFIKATGYDGKDHPSSKTNEPFLQSWKNGMPPKGQERHPACDLNWHHAKAFCEWLAKKSQRKVRLLTDDEWTLAASGKEGRTYPWGSSFEPGRCNIGGAQDGYAESAPVGSFPRGATPEGLMDMAGNIWEWTSEGHLRGGPWCMGPETVRCWDIADEGVDRADDKFGFRICVAD